MYRSVSPAANVRVESDVHPSKLLSPIAVTVPGIEIVINDSQFLKQLPPIVSIPLLRMASDKFVQFSKA